MSTHYRLYISKIQIGCAIPCLIAVQMSCLHNSITFISGKDTGGPIWYTLFYAELEVVFFFLVIFVCGILADVHYVSNRVHRKINGDFELKRNKWLRRWIRSCPYLRIYFGGSNFLEISTPLNIQNFAINQTLSLLLLEN